MGEVINFPNENGYLLQEDEVPSSRFDPTDVLFNAADNDFTDVIVIGRQTNGIFFITSSTNDIGKLLIFLEGAKEVIVSQIDTSTIE